MAQTQIKQAKNITGQVVYDSAEYPAGNGLSEIYVLGSDASVTLRVTGDIVAEAQTEIGTLDALTPQDPILEDQGVQDVRNPGELLFTVNGISFDNNDDGFHTTMVCKKGTSDFVVVDLNSYRRDDLVRVLGELITGMTP